MTKFYFIGGAPRSGKTTVLQQLISQKPMLAASTDAIRSVVKGSILPADNPRLFKTARGAFGSEQHLQLMSNKPGGALELELGEAEETWKAVLDFLSYYKQDGKEGAIEGVAILPEKISNSGLDFKAVFIVNLTDQTDVILEHVKTNPNDWLRKYDEETIRAYCKFNRYWNQYYADEAKKYGLPVIEIDTDNFKSSIDLAVKILIDK